MISFYDDLYMTESVKPKINSIKLKLYSGIGTVGVYLISFSNNPADVFDIYPAHIFKQKFMRKNDVFIVGVADSKTSAFTLVSDMINECMDRTGSYTDIRKYYENKFGRR